MVFGHWSTTTLRIVLSAYHPYKYLLNTFLLHWFTFFKADLGETFSLFPARENQNLSPQHNITVKTNTVIAGRWPGKSVSPSSALFVKMGD